MQRRGNSDSERDHHDRRPWLAILGWCGMVALMTVEATLSPTPHPVSQSQMPNRRGISERVTFEIVTPLRFFYCNGAAAAARVPSVDSSHWHSLHTSTLPPPKNENLYVTFNHGTPQRVYLNPHLFSSW